VLAQLVKLLLFRAGFSANPKVIAQNSPPGTDLHATDLSGLATITKRVGVDKAQRGRLAVFVSVAGGGLFHLFL